jgi:uncharacterized protein (TIGR02246 family)
MMSNTIGSSFDRELISAIIERQSNAWNLGDAKAFAENFMPDGCFVNVLGMLTYGREPFEAQHAKIFGSIYAGSLIFLPIRRIHFVRPDVAIVDIDAELKNTRAVPAGLVSFDGVIKTRLQEIFVKEGDQWMVASFHNVDIKSAP